MVMCTQGSITLVKKNKWAEFDEDGLGEDYLARRIRVQLTRKWHFDPATMTYFDEPV